MKAFFVIPQLYNDVIYNLHKTGPNDFEKLADNFFSIQYDLNCKFKMFIKCPRERFFGHIMAPG